MSDQNPMLTKLLQLLDDNQAIDVKVIDVRKQTTITDYMIIASGRSSRHVKAISQKIMEDMKSTGSPAMNCTGLETGDWVLIDFSDFIIHVMQPEYRQYYNLEGLWDEPLQN
ncbi:ribosome silencing factor [Legionella anisa]|uniref:Ribosomal silencing factor RsfS n=1 Tax=Legionella anisa TaxID=28082 RepID=A0AAX0WT50_9GAMM|nr:ribosome silencing factor [Legionella anisa]AWN74474.1 ribosome silencing factor [Legionella anisa]KTC70461.1 Ribosomal silencing factor RsfS [Legionella anisa]MBN5936791.1 ribosome silencing factor [Legionella anisa]MCW8425417.1 ribosome silencing factor [Legionella anisa]MCW8449152.1 ribosome silencing factor [Legionella anisa]